MSDYKISNSGTKQIFRSRILERLTRTHFLVPIIMYSTISAFLIIFILITNVIPLFNMAWLYFAGMFFFSLVEYLIHRFIFHFHAETEAQKNFQYRMHGVHHEFPKDKDRLVMPPIVSVFIAAFFYFLFRFTMGDAHYSFYAGFVEGYCIYLFIHYAVHRYRTPKNFLKFLWQHHSLHHYGMSDTAFGVSMPLWDHLFRTMPKSKEERMAMKMADKYL